MTDHTHPEHASSLAEQGGEGHNPLSSVVLAALGEMALPVEVRVGSARMSLRELTECRQGTLLTLDTAVGGLADLLVGGQLVARGELVAIDDQLGFRIVEIVSMGGRDET